MTTPPALRSILFRLHWALGLTAGLVLAVMGATGALLSYEEALTALADRDRTAVTARETPRLTPEALIARVEAQVPGVRIDALTLPADPAASVRARFARPQAGAGRPPSQYLDPYDGAVLGPVRLEAAFATVRALHRWLLMPDEGRGWGRTLTGACALALLVFLGTGIYLRWPQVHRWRIWLKPALSRPGRARWWSLHAVAGTWFLPVYLVIALSGLTWSYTWMKDAATWALTGAGPETKPVRTADRGMDAGAQQDRRPGRAALDAAWAAFAAGSGPEAAVATLLLPGAEGRAIRVRWFAAGGVERNEARFEAGTGALLGSERAADAPLGRRIADNMLEVHRGRFFGAAPALVFCLAALAMPGLAATGLTLYALRRRAARRRASAAPRLAPAAGE